MGKWRDRRRWTWARLGDASLAKEIIFGILGLKGAFAAGVTAVMVGLGYAEHLPLAILGTIGLLAFSGALWGAAQLAAIWSHSRLGERRNQRGIHDKRPPNFGDPATRRSDEPDLIVQPGRHAHLLLNVKAPTRTANSQKFIVHSECSVEVASSAPIAMKRCSLWVDSITYDDRRYDVRDFVRHGENFELQPGKSQPFTFITRDLADIVKRPPHVLKLQKADFVLPDNRSFYVEMEIRSQYEFPTFIRMIVRTGIGEHLDVSVLSQKV